MRSETPSEYLTLTLTRQEKELLLRLADEHGATLRGYVRKLIRDAGNAVAARGCSEPAPKSASDLEEMEGQQNES